MRNVIQEVSAKMNDRNLPWLLAGKTAGVLQGVLVHSNTLSIFSTEKGSAAFSDVFDPFRDQKIKYRDDRVIAGLTGTFRIRDVEVTIIGAPQIIIEHRKWPLPIEDIFGVIEPVEIGLHPVPMLPLDWLFITAVIEKDMQFAQAILETGLERNQIVKLLEETGLSYYLKPKLEELR